MRTIPSGTLLALAIAVFACPPAAAVLIDSLDGTANTSAPPDDPGWANVGVQGYLSSVYLGDGWVLTANHVPVMGVTSTFGSVAYSPVPYSRKIVPNADGSVTDLQLFRISEPPDLPTLRIRPVSPQVGDEVIMIGNGRDRGAVRRDLFAPPTLRDGWEWIDDTHSMRWGTNRVAEVDLDISVRRHGVRHFTLKFDRGLPTPHEAIATPGDSGGGVFIKRDGVWELAGIMFAVDSSQPPLEKIAVLSTPPLYAIRTYCADLSHYRDWILETIGRVSPPPGPGVAGR